MDRGYENLENVDIVTGWMDSSLANPLKQKAMAFVSPIITGTALLHEPTEFLKRKKVMIINTAKEPEGQTRPSPLTGEARHCE
jgi:hypothetical protein